MTQENEAHKSNNLDYYIGLNRDIAHKIIYFSFKYSQGDPTLQRLLFRYIHIKHPDWRLPEQVDFELIEKLKKTAKGLIYKGGGKFHTTLSTSTLSSTIGTHYEIDDGDLHNNMEGQAGNMQRVLTGNFDQSFYQLYKIRPEENKEYGITDSSTESQILTAIGLGTIERDYHFLVKIGGRKRRNPDSNNPFKDPFRSFFIDYVIKGEATELPILTEMFKGVRKELSNLNDTKQKLLYLFKLSTVITAYNNNHPENQILFSPQKAL